MKMTFFKVLKTINENLPVYTKPFENLSIEILALALALASALVFKYKHCLLHN